MADRDSAGRIVLGRSSNSEGSIASPLVPPAQSRRRKSRWRRVLGVVLAALILSPVAFLGLGWWQFSEIPTVNVSAALSSRSGRSAMNYLIVGTDSRAGIAEADPNSGAFLSGEVSGARTDTIMILHVNGESTQLASIPRDLWVTDPATGQKGRINSTFAQGPANLIKAVEALGIPVDQYLEINFVSFGKLVDAVGGITIDFPAPAKDDHSGLLVPNAGPQRLDGVQALAYVRSRYYSEFIDGRWKIDGTADIGRTERQRSFLSALVHAVSTERNPLTLLSLSGAGESGMKRSETFSYFDALGLSWTLKDAKLQPVALPVTPRRTTGGADILELQGDATQILRDLAS